MLMSMYFFQSDFYFLCRSNIGGENQFSIWPHGGATQTRNVHAAFLFLVYFENLKLKIKSLCICFI